MRGTRCSMKTCSARHWRVAQHGAILSVGHYLESRGDGEHMHWVSDFDDTWERLRAGKLDPTWFARLPTLAATLINKRILQKHGFSRRFQHAADLDLFLRCRRDSARFHHANTTIARIAGKPRWQLLRRIAECRRIFSRETTNVPAVRVLCASLRATECEPLLRSWIDLGTTEALRQPDSGSRNGAIRRQSGMEPSVLSRRARDLIETSATTQSDNPQMTRIDADRQPRTWNRGPCGFNG